jgi:hypothetical protein
MTEAFSTSGAMPLFVEFTFAAVCFAVAYCGGLWR